MNEIVSAKGDPATASTAGAIAFMIDQSHNVEGKIEPEVPSARRCGQDSLRAVVA